MKDILISDLRKIDILEALSDGKVHTYYRLSQEVGTNYETIKMNCRFLELLEFVKINRVAKEESASKKPYYAVRITDAGLKWWKGVFKKVRA